MSINQNSRFRDKTPKSNTNERFWVKSQSPMNFIEQHNDMPCCNNAKSSYVLLSKCAKQLLLIIPQSRIIIMSLDGRSLILIHKVHKVVKICGCLPVKIWQVKKPPISLAYRQFGRWPLAKAQQHVRGKIGKQNIRDVTIQLNNLSMKDGRSDEKIQSSLRLISNSLFL